MKKLSWKRKDFSYRKKTRYYYALTFIVPIVIIIIANVITQNAVKAQVLESNEKILKQFFRLMDERLDMMTEDVTSIAGHSVVKEYIQLTVQDSKKYAYKSMNVGELLNAVYGKSNGQNYKEFMVWFPYHDQVISGVSGGSGGGVGRGTNLDFYCHVYYNKRGESAGQLREIVMQDSVAPVFRRCQIGDEECISLTAKPIGSVKVPDNSKNLGYTVTAIANRSYLENCIGDGILTDGENVLLYDKNGELLFTYQQDGLEQLPSEYRKNGTYEYAREQNTYTLMVRKSDVMDGYYVMEIPRAAYLQPISRIRMVSMFGVLFSILVGIFVSSKISRLAYRPIERMLDEFNKKEEKVAYDHWKHDEFEYMTDVFRKQEQENEKLEYQKWKERELSKRRELLLAEMEGRELSGEETEYLEMKMPNVGRIFGGILQLDHCGTAGWDMISFVVENVLEEVFENYCRCDVLPFSSTRYMVLFYLDQKGDEEEMKQLLAKGISYLRQKFEVTSAFGAGSLSYGLEGLHTLYQEAQQTLEYCFLLGKNKVISYEEVKGREPKRSFVEEGPMYHRINDFLKKEQVREAEAQSFVNELTAWYGVDLEASMETVENYQYEVLSALNRIFSGHNVEYFRRQTYFRRLSDAADIREYLALFAGILCEIGLNMQENVHKRSLAAKVKEYVEAHYEDSSLSVAAIGEAFGMQPSYLSKIFRNEYDTLLLNYISFYRIECAKKLLKDSSLTVNEIAENIGFLSGNVFIKTFKKYVGITPGKYRSDKEFSVE